MSKANHYFPKQMGTINKILRFLLFIPITVVLMGCVISKYSEDADLTLQSTPLESPETQSVVILATDIPAPTIEPMAAMVNGEIISVQEYQLELARFQAARTSKTELTDKDKNKVLDDLIDLTLLMQGAKENGYVLDDAQLQQRLANLIEKAGGAQTFQAWLEMNHYSEPSFRMALRRATEAAWMRDKIAASVPSEADQAHARQMLFFDINDANKIYSRLQAGEKFETILTEYGILANSDLGWFPKGYLLEPELDRAIFEGKGLQSGQFTNVIKTRLGYHIVEVIERDPKHPLDPDPLLKAHAKAIQDWLAERRNKGNIRITTP